MKCFLCKGQLEEQLTNFMIDVDNCFIIVKNVPSQVCSQCGEVSYSDEVAAKLEADVRAGFDKLMTGQSRAAAKAAGRAVDVSADDFDDAD